MHQPIDWYVPEVDSAGEGSTHGSENGELLHEAVSKSKPSLHFGVLPDVALLRLLNKLGGGDGMRVNEKSRTSPNKLTSEEREAVLGGDVTVEGIARKVRSGLIRNVVIVAGAGISSSAGVPDFRSENSGIYKNIAKYELPYPEAIFELSYFLNRPEPFYDLVSHVFLCHSLNPTPTHCFFRLLQEKSLLKRLYSQNIDMLERKVGLRDDILEEAHGTFESWHCVRCKQKYSLSEVTPIVCRTGGGVPQCLKPLKGPGLFLEHHDRLPELSSDHSNSDTDQSRTSPMPPLSFSSSPKSLRDDPLKHSDGLLFKGDQVLSPSVAPSIVVTNSKKQTDHQPNLTSLRTMDSLKDDLSRLKVDECGGLIRPNIVFFGEELRNGLSDIQLQADLNECDLFIVIGTSLSVEPFASVLPKVPPACPRLLINREEVGKGLSVVRTIGVDCGGFRFDEPDNYRDVKMLMDCDEGVRRFAELCGWEHELDAIIRNSSSPLSGQ
mmetsp:Transcript_17898/g.29655  ORF Transcript_17898/g.29655 Transcript_17898/m.29655 type:complete len:494 (+) Transcript_17898:100-1581(+)